jgi:carboxymethylenebutenolidase
MAVKANWETLKVDNEDMRVYVARPEGADKVPAIFVLQEAFGVNHHMRNVTEQIAGLGYVAVCPELYHRDGQGIELGYEGKDRDEGMQHLSQLTDEGQEADLRAVWDFLQKDPQVDSSRVASTGYCMGGRTSFLANSILPLKCAVSYYGGRIAPALLDRVKDQSGPILFFWGGKDQHIGLAQPRAIVDAMQTAGKPYIDVMFGDADHGFSCDERKSYHKDATKQAWALFVQFLQDNL